MQFRALYLRQFHFTRLQTCLDSKDASHSMQSVMALSVRPQEKTANMQWSKAAFHWLSLPSLYYFPSVECDIDGAIKFEEIDGGLYIMKAGGMFLDFPLGMITSAMADLDQVIRW